jgi:hypothetical protein
MDREKLSLATLLAVLSILCSLFCLLESYRSFVAVLPILQQEDRLVDLWAVRHEHLTVFIIVVIEVVSVVSVVILVLQFHHNKFSKQ